MILPKKLNALSNTEVSLKIISILASRGKLGVRELARELNIAPSTSLRFLRTFAECGFASLDEESRMYHPGLQLIKIAAQIGQDITLSQLARIELEKLFSQTHETVNLGILDEDMQHVLHVDKIMTDGVIRIDTPLGEEAPSHCTALGKAILAFKPREAMERAAAQFRFTRFTPKTIVDPVSLLHEFSEIRRQGYAIDNEEFTKHLICIAAPIFHQNEVVASISLSTLSLLNRDIEKEYADLVRDAAGRISSELSSISKVLLYRHQ